MHWGPATCMQKHSFRSLALFECLAIVMTIYARTTFLSN